MQSCVKFHRRDVRHKRIDLTQQSKQYIAKMRRKGEEEEKKEKEAEWRRKKRGKKKEKQDGSWSKKQQEEEEEEREERGIRMTQKGRRRSHCNQKDILN